MLIRGLWKVIRFIPALLTMSVIFFLSHQSDPIGVITKALPAMVMQFNVRSIPASLGHFCLYFILTLAIWCTLDDHQQNHGISYLRVFLIVLVFAISDEVHQHFIPNRTPSIDDVYMDALGSITALAWIFIFQRLSALARRIVRNLAHNGGNV